MRIRNVVAGSLAALLLACGSTGARAQALIATELAESFAKSVISAVAGEALNRLFGTPTLTAEEAAKQVRSHLAALDVKVASVDTRALADDVHDYMVERDGINIDTRRITVRKILYQTSAVEAVLQRLVSTGSYMDVAGDYMLVVSTRLAFLAEQGNVDFAASAGNNARSLAASRRIVAAVARDALNFLVPNTMKHLGEDLKPGCVQRIPHKTIYTANGGIVRDEINARYGNRKYDARYHICWDWIARSLGPGSFVADHYPPPFLLWHFGRVYEIPNRNVFEFVYKSSNDGTHVFDMASSADEARRLLIVRSMDNYQTRLGKPSGVFASWADLAIRHGDAEQRKTGERVHAWLRKS